MFANLPASAPGRAAVSRSAWGVSTLFHVLVVSAVVWGTSRAGEAPPTPAAPVVFVSLWETPEPPAEPEQPPAEPAGPDAAPVEVVRTDLPEGFQELSAPDEILATIPPPSSVAIRAEDYSGMGVAGGVARGRALLPVAADTVARPVEPAPLSVAVVDEAPRVLNREQIAVRMRDLYPLRYRMAEIEGEVLVQLVVGTDGRVEAQGLSIVSSTYPEFEGPSRELVEELRWEPARRNGQPVRVWVRLPVTWTID